MSQENVEMVRQCYDAWNRDDLQWVLDRCASDIEFRPNAAFAALDQVYPRRAGDAPGYRRLPHLRVGDTGRAMSQENVELVITAMRAAWARPKPDFATMNEVFHPDHVLVPLTTIDTDEVRGARGYQAYLRQGLAGDADSA